MTKSKGKRGRPTLEELLERPECYYCNKDFDDLKILVDHQKAKHYKCQVMHCNRRLNTVGGLRVHMQQVHKEDLKLVPNALEDRNRIDLEIFGMEGIPVDVQQERINRITNQYYKEEAEHRARTGNNLHSQGEQQHAAKKPKLDDEARADLKRRAVEAKARREAQKAAAAAGLPMSTDASSPAPHAGASPLSAHPPIPPGVEQLSIASPVPANHAPFQHPSAPSFAAFGSPSMSTFTPPFHPLPLAVSPTGWAHSTGLPGMPGPAGPSGGYAPPVHLSPYSSQAGNHGLPSPFPSPFPRSSSDGLMTHTAAHAPPAVHGVEGCQSSDIALSKLMDEQSRIALDRLNGKTTPLDSKIEQSTAESPKQGSNGSNANKLSKPDKKKQRSRLVLSDNEVSWEEHRAAKLPTHQSAATRNNNSLLGAATDAVTGTVDKNIAES